MVRTYTYTLRLRFGYALSYQEYVRRRLVTTGLTATLALLLVRRAIFVLLICPLRHVVEHIINQNLATLSFVNGKTFIH